MIFYTENLKLFKSRSVFQHTFENMTLCFSFKKMFPSSLKQQGCYNHDITILLQPCVANLVTFLLYHDCIKLVRTTL